MISLAGSSLPGIFLIISTVSLTECIIDLVRSDQQFYDDYVVGDRAWFRTDGGQMKHLAQINVGRLLYPQDDPRVAEFFDNLDRVNAAAERMPGFVWRLKDDSGNATSISAFDDPALLLNMSVWESAETFETFVWQTVHTRFYRKRTGWFEQLGAPHFAMWWIEPGHIPTAAEGRERLEHLRQHGPSDHAFGWESLPSAKLWREARCG